MPSSFSSLPPLHPVFRIRDILVRIRILGSVPLTNGSGSVQINYWSGSWRPKNIRIRIRKTGCITVLSCTIEQFRWDKRDGLCRVSIFCCRSIWRQEKSTICVTFRSIGAKDDLILGLYEFKIVCWAQRMPSCAMANLQCFGYGSGLDSDSVRSVDPDSESGIRIQDGKSDPQK